MEYEKNENVPWYIHSIGDWETCQNRYYGSCSLFGKTTKKSIPLYIDSYAGVDMSAWNLSLLNFPLVVEINWT